MADPIDRAPRILGVATVVYQPGERRYTASFGPVEAGYACLPNLDGSESAPFTWWVRFVKHECQRSNVLGSERTAALAAAAIERELLAIKSAIPDRPTLGPRYCKTHGGYGFTSDCVACSANETVGHPEYTPPAPERKP